ncbi:hypothetical protein P3L51_35175 [Streptomyces sp. PSRA5]|uniref:hypothetical protein n=1 Tax=Streptomyces panacea TaxID=3035064 RepID=UPI00339CEA64
MKAILGFISFVLVTAGVTGLLNEWADRLPAFFGFFRFLIPDGYEVLGYVVIALFGLAAGYAAGLVEKNATA